MGKWVRISVPIRFYEMLKQTVEKQELWPSIDAMAREAGDRIIKRHHLQ